MQPKTTGKPCTDPTVLVVDDDDGVRRLMAIILQQAGFRVLEADSGRAAQALMEAEPKRVCLAILDIQMPDMDGPQTLAALKEIRPDLSSLYVTGFAGQYSTDALLATGAVDVLIKPFAPMTLVATARRALGVLSAEC